MSTQLYSTAGLDGLTASISGRVLRPGDEAYEDARRVHNGMVDRRPAVIVRCRTAADRRRRFRR